jgi:hypothetical protein
MSAYVVKNFEPGLWTVGHYQPDGKFDPEADYTDQVAAGQRCHFLNGGTSTALTKERDELRALIDAHQPALASQVLQLRALIAEILADFWPSPRFQGVHEGLADAQQRVDFYRHRAGLEPQS